MTQKHSADFLNYSIVTPRGAKSEGWSKSADQRQSRLDSDIEVFMAKGGQMEQCQSVRLNAPMLKQVTNPDLHHETLFDGDSITTEAPKFINSPWNPTRAGLGAREGGFADE